MAEQLTTNEDLPPRHVGDRLIPVPRSISKEARAVLVPQDWNLSGALPARADVATWRLIIELADAGILAVNGPLAACVHATVETIAIGGVVVYHVVPNGIRPGRERKVVLDIHAGAHLFAGGECCRAMGVLAADRFGLETWSVDYRMPPDHPYPAALDDCLTVYKVLLHDHDPQDIIVNGPSAGGNLAASLMLRARDEGLALPAALVLQSPEVDLTESGDSFQTNLGIDSVLTQSLAPMIELYAPDHDLTDPYLSPLFGDLSGFPRTFLQCGTRDLFLSNTVRMHRALRKAGVVAELHVFEAMPHGGFGNTPDDQDVVDEIRRFVDSVWDTE